jgi:hypothetical protein
MTAAALVASGLGAVPASAQAAQPPATTAPVVIPGLMIEPARPPAVTPRDSAVPPRNTTVVPRTAPEAKPAPAANMPGPGQVSLLAVLTQDGQSIEQGLTWRLFADRPGPDGKPRLISTHREASPLLRLEPGDYIVNVAFGRAHLTRKITVSAERGLQERFVLNAGGLKLIPALANGEAITDRTVTYDIYSDERDQAGQRIRIASGVRAGVIMRLNAGIYNVISTYGDANAVARADVTVEAGKLTEATLAHAAAKVTFKLVAQAGGDAIADTQWIIATGLGETVKESVGALPTHILAPGIYVVSARNGGEVSQRQFMVQAGDNVQVEVVRR